MSTKRLSSNDVSTIIFACAILVLGILFCCFGSWALSYILGGFVIFIGVLFVMNSIIRTHLLLTTNGLVGVVLGALGTMIIVHNLAGLLLSFIPWIMISVGALVIADAFLRYFLRRSIGGRILATEIAVGALISLVGFGVLFIENLADFTAVVFGALLVIYAMYVIISTFVKRN